MMGVQGLWELFAYGVLKVWGVTMICLTAGVAAVFVKSYAVAYMTATA